MLYYILQFLIVVLAVAFVTKQKILDKDVMTIAVITTVGFYITDRYMLNSLDSFDDDKYNIIDPADPITMYSNYVSYGFHHKNQGSLEPFDETKDPVTEYNSIKVDDKALTTGWASTVDSPYFSQADRDGSLEDIIRKVDLIVKSASSTPNELNDSKAMLYKAVDTRLQYLATLKDPTVLDKVQKETDFINDYREYFLVKAGTTVSPPTLTPEEYVSQYNKVKIDDKSLLDGWKETKSYITTNKVKFPYKGKDTSDMSTITDEMILPNNMFTVEEREKPFSYILAQVMAKIKEPNITKEEIYRQGMRLSNARFVREIYLMTKTDPTKFTAGDRIDKYNQETPEIQPELGFIVKPEIYVSTLVSSPTTPSPPSTTPSPPSPSTTPTPTPSTTTSKPWYLETYVIVIAIVVVVVLLLTILLLSRSNKNGSTKYQESMN